MNKNEVKKIAKTLQDESKRIAVEWDAGGDQTPVWFKALDKEGKELEVNNQLTYCFDFLRDLIIMELELPNASENYHRGKGEIVYQEGKIVLIYSAKAFTNDYEEEAIEFTLEDKYNLLTLQSRANISFSLRLGDADAGIYDRFLDEEDEKRFHIHTRILEGDDLSISEEMEAYYQAQFEQVGERFEAELGKMLYDKTLCEVTLTYDERDLLGKGMMKVDKYYEISEIYENEEVVLIK